MVSLQKKYYDFLLRLDTKITYQHNYYDAIFDNDTIVTL